MKTATVIYHAHVLVPSKRRTEQATGQTIAALDPKWDRPYIALLDGKPVLRKDWNLYVENGRILVFIDAEAIPAGGGGERGCVLVYFTLLHPLCQESRSDILKTSHTRHRCGFSVFHHHSDPPTR